MTKTDNSTVLDSIRGRLNDSTGVFLEAKVFDVLSKNTQIRARREEPYVNLNTSELYEGQIDIFAASLVNESRAVCMNFECKRANPEQKFWVFEKRQVDSEPEYYPFDYRDAMKGSIDYNKNIFFPSLGYDGMKFFDKTIQGFEFNERTGALSKSTQDRMFNAFIQANEATSSFIEEYSRVNQILGMPETNLFILYLPVVVTTASIWIMDYKPELVDWKSGTINHADLGLTKKDWILHEFPLPYSLRTRYAEGVGPTKRPTFVVSAEKLTEFIPKLLADCKRYITDF